MKTILRRLLRLQLMLLLIVLILLGALSLFEDSAFAAGTEESAERREKEFVTPVRVVQPRIIDLEESITVHGTIRSSNQVTLLPKVTGAITSISVDVGHPVRRDQLIAEIDPRAYELGLKQADAAFENALSTWRRLDSLYKSGNAARQDWENAGTAREAAEAQAQTARLRYGWTRILAPVDGVVLAKHIKVGSLAAPEAGTPIVTIGSLENLEAEFLIPESRYPAFSAYRGSAARIVEVRLDAFPEQPLPARIASVAPYVDPSTRSFAVVCALEPDNADVIPGMLVSARFILRVRPDARVLPLDALIGGDTLWRVKDGRAEKVRLPAPVTSGDYVLLPDHSPGGDYVTEGRHFLEDGARIRVIPPEYSKLRKAQNDQKDQESQDEPPEYTQENQNDTPKDHQKDQKNHKIINKIRELTRETIKKIGKLL